MLTTAHDVAMFSRNIISYHGIGLYLLCYLSAQYLGTSLHLEIPVTLCFSNSK